MAWSSPENGAMFKNEEGLTMRKLTSTATGILLIVVSLTAASCSDEECDCDPCSPSPQPSVILPLAVGNSWTYLDSVAVSGSAHVSDAHISVAAETTLTIQSRDYPAFKVEEVDSLVSKEKTTRFLKNEFDGLWTLGIRCTGNLSTVQYLSAKYPATVGDTWTSVYMRCLMGSGGVLGPGVAECTHTDAVYDAPAGAFTCYTIHEHYETAGEYDIYWYFAPNVGMVAMEFYSSSLTLKRRLVSYSLK